MKSARKGSTPRAAEPRGWAAAAPDDTNFRAEHLAASAASRGAAARGMSLRRRLIGVTPPAAGIRDRVQDARSDKKGLCTRAPPHSGVRFRTPTCPHQRDIVHSALRSP